MDSSGVLDHQTMSNDAGKKSNLLLLPTELRDQIFESLILKPTNTITMLMNSGCHKNEISACLPPICLVNKQFRAETLPTFYGGNFFTAQLDNDQDLETAKRWLAAIGDDNVRYLKHLVLCGWIRVPFGHMVSRRWIRAVFNLRSGTMDVGATQGAYAAEAKPGLQHEREHEEILNTIEELKGAFQSAVKARGGMPFDVQSAAELMEGFNMLCTGY